MIVQVIRLTAWEWFKLRRRWMPWILAAVILLVAQLGLWISYAAYHNESFRSFVGQSSNSMGFEGEDELGETFTFETDCVEIIEGTYLDKIGGYSESQREPILEAVEDFRSNCEGLTVRSELREGFVLPSSISDAIGSAHGITVILVMILAASAVGSEYGWGTLRTTLTRGTGRWQFLASKLIAIILMVAAGLVVVSIGAALASLLAAVIPPDETGGVADSGRWSDSLVIFAKEVYAVAPFAVLAALLAIVTSSSAMGISISLGYYVVELIVVPLLGFVDSLKEVPSYLVGGAANTWLQQEALVSVEISSESGEAPISDTQQAFIVLLAYILVLGATAFWLFQRRDITGAKGG